MADRDSIIMRSALNRNNKPLSQWEQTYYNKSLYTPNPYENYSSMPSTYDASSFRLNSVNKPVSTRERLADGATNRRRAHLIAGEKA